MWRRAGGRDEQERLRLFVELPRVGTDNDCEIGLELVPERHQEGERVRARESRAERREDHERDAEDREDFSAEPHQYQSSASVAGGQPRRSASDGSIDHARQAGSAAAAHATAARILAPNT